MEHLAFETLASVIIREIKHLVYKHFGGFFFLEVVVVLVKIMKHLYFVSP